MIDRSRGPSTRKWFVACPTGKRRSGWQTYPIRAAAGHSRTKNLQKLDFLDAALYYHMMSTIMHLSSGGPLGPYGQRTISKTNQVNNQNTSLITFCQQCNLQNETCTQLSERHILCCIGTIQNHYRKKLYYGPVWKIKENVNDLT